MFVVRNLLQRKQFHKLRMTVMFYITVILFLSKKKFICKNKYVDTEEQESVP